MITYSTYATPRADLGEAFHEFSIDGQSFIADRVLPDLGVQKEDGTITVITRENFRSDDARRAEGGTFNRISITGEDLAYLCKNFGLEIPVTDRERRKYVDDFQIELEKISILRWRMLLAREIRVKDLIFNTTTWDSSDSDLYTDNSSAPWDAADSGIIAQVQAAIQKVLLMGVRPNALIVGEVTAVNMTNNTGIIGRFQNTDIITIEMIRNAMVTIFGLRYLIVGDAVYNTADEGQSYSGSFIWPDDYAMVARVAEGPGMPMTTPCIGRTLRWNDMVNNVGGTPEQYREEQTKSEIYRMEDYLQEKILEKYFGHLMLIDA